MNQKNTARYTPYTTYIIIWVVCIIILFRLPLPKISYSVVSVLYEVIASRIYMKKTRTYLMENYKEECTQAMNLPARQIYNIGDCEFNFRDFQYSMRKKRVANPDKMLIKVYRNNNYVAYFFQFIFATAILNLTLTLI